MQPLDRISDYSGNVQDQHKELLVMLNELRDAVNSGKSTKAVPPILNRLVTYALGSLHNGDHTALQAKPQVYAAHKSAGDKLTHEVMKLMQDLEKGRTAIPRVEIEAVGMYKQSVVWNRPA